MSSNPHAISQIRKPEESPLRKLTTGLLATYKLINARYYEQKKARNLAKASGALPDKKSSDYVVTVGEILGRRYRVLGSLGRGSFGQVVSAEDMLGPTDHNGERPKVAVKVIKANEAFRRQARTEIKLLQTLNRRDPNAEWCIVRFHEWFDHMGHTCLVFEHLSFNAYDLLRRTNFKGISLLLLRKFARQVLRALAYLCLPEIDIIHCDLKPENVLFRVPNRSAIRVIDFGSSCKRTQPAFKYIQSRFYRSPEVILELPYDQAIDMWSVGVMLVELHVGVPLFAGRNESDQIHRYVSLLGLPPRHMLTESKKAKKFFDCIQPPSPKSDLPLFGEGPHHPYPAQSSDTDADLSYIATDAIASSTREAEIDSQRRLQQLSLNTPQGGTTPSAITTANTTANTSDIEIDDVLLPEPAMYSDATIGTPTSNPAALSIAGSTSGSTVGSVSGSITGSSIGPTVDPSSTTWIRNSLLPEVDIWSSNESMQVFSWKYLTRTLGMEEGEVWPFPQYPDIPLDRSERSARAGAATPNTWDTASEGSFTHFNPLADYSSFVPSQGNTNARNTPFGDISKGTTSTATGGTTASATTGTATGMPRHFAPSNILGPVSSEPTPHRRRSRSGNRTVPPSPNLSAATAAPGTHPNVGSHPQSPAVRGSSAGVTATGDSTDPHAGETDYDGDTPSPVPRRLRRRTIDTFVSGTGSATGSVASDTGYGYGYDEYGADFDRAVFRALENTQNTTVACPRCSQTSNTVSGTASGTGASTNPPTSGTSILNTTSTSLSGKGTPGSLAHHPSCPQYIRSVSRQFPDDNQTVALSQDRSSRAVHSVISRPSLPSLASYPSIATFPSQLPFGQSGSTGGAGSVASTGRNKIRFPPGKHTSQIPVFRLKSDLMNQSNRRRSRTGKTEKVENTETLANITDNDSNTNTNKAKGVPSTNAITGNEETMNDENITTEGTTDTSAAMKGENVPVDTDSSGTAATATDNSRPNDVKKSTSNVTLDNDKNNNNTTANTATTSNQTKPEKGTGASSRPTSLPVHTNLRTLLGAYAGGPRGARISERTGHSFQDYMQFIDLVLRMLHYDPKARIRPLAALNHPFLRSDIEEANSTLGQSKSSSTTVPSNRQAGHQQQQHFPPSFSSSSSSSSSATGSGAAHSGSSGVGSSHTALRNTAITVDQGAVDTGVAGDLSCGSEHTPSTRTTTNGASSKSASRGSIRGVPDEEEFVLSPEEFAEFGALHDSVMHAVNKKIGNGVPGMNDEGVGTKEYNEYVMNLYSPVGNDMYTALQRDNTDDGSEEDEKKEDVKEKKTMHLEGSNIIMTEGPVPFRAKRDKSANPLRVAVTSCTDKNVSVDKDMEESQLLSDVSNHRFGKHATSSRPRSSSSSLGHKHVKYNNVHAGETSSPTVVQTPSPNSAFTSKSPKSLNAVIHKFAALSTIDAGSDPSQPSPRDNPIVLCTQGEPLTS